MIARAICGSRKETQMGLIGWVRDEEYVKEIKAHTKYYQKEKENLRTNGDSNSIWQRWSDVFTSNEISTIREWMQYMIDATQKFNCYRMNTWWKNFINYLNSNSYINVSESYELYQFFTNYDIYNKPREKEIEKKIWEYYLKVKGTSLSSEVLKQRQKVATKQWKKNNSYKMSEIDRKRYQKKEKCYTKTKIRRKWQ